MGGGMGHLDIVEHSRTFSSPRIHGVTKIKGT